jgi:tagaturonate reductase
MKLDRNNLQNIHQERVKLPNAEIFNLPVKVLQFGTGVLLRGLPDYYIDKANRQGKYNGRIVVVKSTDQGSTEEFDNQDSLYTICVRGIQNGESVSENIINSSISKVLVAGTQWQDVLDIASSVSLETIISNTTEVGIQLVEDDVHAKPPVSFPGKLLAVLFHRYTMFNGAEDKGLVIVPTELIVDNATKLEDILVKLARKNQLSEAFIKWMQNSNHFCNSLVDRIVPGKPDAEKLSSLQEELGYTDKLLTMSEVYSLWAIEGNDKVKEKLSFAEVDNGVIITPDINLHRELKLRMLNGTHTLSCGVAFLAGFETVKSAMDSPKMSDFMSNLMQKEIAPAIPYEISEEVSTNFSNNVLDRFRNPYIKHLWLSITMNYTSKLRMRVIPVLLNYAEKLNAVPDLMAFGFAAYINFMKSEIIDGKFYGKLNNQRYLINDDKAADLQAHFNNNPEDKIVNAILSDTVLWGTNLSELPGFAKAVSKHYKDINESSIQQALNKLSF